MHQHQKCSGSDLKLEGKHAPPPPVTPLTPLAHLMFRFTHNEADAALRQRPLIPAVSGGFTGVALICLV